MKAILFAAGRGTRMMPLTANVPKPMVPILGRPLLEFVFDSLPNIIDEVIVVVGYKREQIQKHFGSLFSGKSVRYVVQVKLTGTADALNLCRPLLSTGERFLVLNTDDIFGKESLDRCLLHHRTILVTEVADPRPYGVVTVSDCGRVTTLEEKPVQPASRFVAPGAYVLDTHLFEYEPQTNPSGEKYFTTMLSQMLINYPVYAERTGLWVNCTVPEDLEKAGNQLLQYI